jgi:ferredoxin/flavodoxin---NADP+ reductase
VHATGSAIDRRLGIPGEDLPGSIGSGQMVGWYCGHPDHCAPPRLDVAAAAVVGAGNVALDVARVLARTADELAPTDVPDAVLDALRHSGVRDVHVLVRRGPQHVKFTPVELRQLGDLADAEVVVHDDGLLEGGLPDDEAITDRRERANLTVLTEWARSTPGTASRRIHLRFFRSPVRVLGTERVTGVVVERTALTPDGRVRGTGEEETLEVGLVVRAVGYTAAPIPGLPFDVATGTVPNEAGRVVDERGEPVPGQYVTGWIRRGPTGVIGTNKHDAVEVAACVLADLPGLPPPARPDAEDLDAVLVGHGVRPVDWSAWLRLDAEEVRRGEARGAERIKVADLADMLAAVHGVPAGPDARRGS